MTNEAKKREWENEVAVLYKVVAALRTIKPDNADQKETIGNLIEHFRVDLDGAREVYEDYRERCLY